MNQYSRQVAMKGEQGFTLIELMIVVLVLAILAGIAMASYEYAMVKTRRGAAEGCLLEYAQQLERQYTVNTGANTLTYTALAKEPACVGEVATHYTIAKATIANGGRGFSLSAKPEGRQAKADTKCGTLTLNNLGVKGAGDVAYCW